MLSQAEKSRLLAGMREVTKEQFFGFLRDDPRDIMPTAHVSPFYSPWRTRADAVIGITFPGWKNPGDPSSYFLRMADFDRL